MYLSFVVRIARSKYPATVHQVSSISFARLAVTAMARTHTTEATQATAQVNLRIGTSLAESLHNTTEEDVIASISLKRAYRQGSKPVAGEACYQLGLLHERRAAAALLRVLEGDNSGSIAPELEWAEAMRSADACFRDAIEARQRRPIYPGDKVCIHGLVSSRGRRLNQREGVAVSHVESSGRFGVAIDGIGIKYIRLANLTILDSYEDCAVPCVSGGCDCGGCFVQADTR